jgi:hypothetical protein
MDLHNGGSFMQKQIRENISEELTSINNLTREELIERWEQANQQTPPRSISRRLLVYAAGYSIQVKNQGGLRPETKRKLQRLATSTTMKNSSSVSSKSRPVLVPGTRLVREWRGNWYSVEVTDEAYLFEGANFTSLSHIARTITGTRWSGPRFFGL